MIKNKLSKFLIISIACLAFIFIYTIKVKADSGFDASWDSGSYSSDSSYDSSYYGSDYGHGGSSSDPNERFLVIYSFISFGVYLVIVYLIYPHKNIKEIPIYFIIFYIILNGFILYLIFNKLLSIVLTLSCLLGLVVSKISNLLKNNSNNNKDNKQLDNIEIENKFSNLDLNIFFDIYKKIQIAWMDNDIERVRSILSDEIFNTYKMQLETLRVKNQKNIMEDISLKKVYINNITEKNNKEIIDVIMCVTCKDYLIDCATNKVLRGNKNKNCYYEYKLSFMRLFNNQTEICPNCGSTLKAGASVKCEFCGSIINRQSDNFILIDKKMIHQE